MPRTRIALAALLALAAACGKSRPIGAVAGHTVTIPGGGPSTGGPGGDITVNVAACARCHGDATRVALATDAAGIEIAPPRDSTGRTSGGGAIGAHLAHLRGSSGTAPRYAAAGVPCASCHVVPAGTAQHATDVVQLRGLAANAWPGQPAISPKLTALGCEATYCHGNFPGGLAKTMSWTGTAADAACGSCHGAPPATQRDGTTAHSSSTDCAGCHGAGYALTGITGAALATHLDGVFQVPAAGHPAGWKEPDQHGLAAINRVLVSGQPQGGLAFAGCTSCHTGFGQAGGAGNASSCDACHANPAAVGGTFTTGTYPNHASWRTECTFCHGGKDNTSGAPPRDTHVISSAAGTQPTSGPTVGAHTSHAAARHGISPALACTTCHPGPYANATDPGHVGSATAAVAFGAVGASPGTGSYLRASGCSATYCHGNFPGGAGAAPAWTGTFGATFTLGCTSCHGSPPALAATHHPPNDACATCHGTGYSKTGAATGTVAAASHVDGTVQKPASGCTACHGSLAGLAGAAVPPSDAHSAPGFAAGSVDVTGAAAGIAVGAHQKHLTGTTFRSTPIACVECHAVPAAGDTAHATGAGTGGARATVAFGALATQAGVLTPTFTGSTSAAGGATAGSCASTWCHGNIRNGANVTVSWAGASSTAACGTCHGLPPAGSHPTLAAGKLCADCHTGYGGSQGGAPGSFSVNPALHLDGTIQATGHVIPYPASQHGPAALDPTTGGLATCAGCHVGFGTANAGGATPSSSDCNACHATITGSTPWLQACTFCHGGNGGNTTGAPPRDTHALSGTAQPTSQVTVGAHVSHVANTGATQTAHGIAAPMGCTSCHPTLWTTADPGIAPGHVHAGTAAVLPALGYSHPTATTGSCASASCHGSALSAATTRGPNAAPVWTTVDGSQSACGSCHKAPPTTANHHDAAAVTTCSRCHPGTVDATGAILVAGGKHINGTVDTSGLTCSTCHGNAANAPVGAQDPFLGAAPIGTATASAAPDTYGNSATTGAGVGVHASHLLGARSAPVRCNACHTVPGTPVHKTGAATAGTVTFGNLATQGGITTAAYAGAGGSCSATYCHGNFGGGAGSAATPTWVTAGALGCTSCHGSPPALAATHHPPNDACATCHGTGYSKTGAATGTVAAASHVDGTVQKPASGCTACHGSLAGLAGAAVPPSDAHSAPGFAAGSVDVTGAAAGIAVGAHQKHLTGTTFRSTPIACVECHAVPAAGDTAHATGAGTGGARATVTWGSLATGAPSGVPVVPSFTGSTSAAGGATAGGCASTWCHGNIPNGNNPTLSWTGTSASAACGSCHGLPPAGNHPALANGRLCSDCHTGYAGSVGGAVASFAVNPALHLNGVLDFVGHPTGWKEPDQHGLAAISFTAPNAGLTACTTCHIAFGPAAGAASDCTGCHQNPSTYGPYTTSPGGYPNHPSWLTECTFCHGGKDGPSGAPPRNTHVISSSTAAQPTSDVTIGAHTSHVGGTGATQTAHGIAAPLGCAQCHPTWTTADPATSSGHVDAATASVLAGLGWSRAAVAPNPANSCATSACHGSSLSASTTRGPGAVPVWTTVDGSQAACGSCHKAPPTTANHHNAAAVTTCNRCHPGTASATGAILVAGGLHLNGAVDVGTLTCSTCHGNGANAPTGGQDANLAAAPIGTATANAAPDTYGNTAATSAGVGVHASHLLGTRSRPVACAACHTVPGTPVHKTGVATAGTVTFTGLATQGSVVPAYAGSGGSCSATYCHGNFAGGAGSGATPTWVTAGALGCTSCHGNPPSAAQGHPQNDACATCHGAGYSKTGATTGTVAAATHVDGTVQLVSGGVPVAESCTSCHGALGRANGNLAGVTYDANQAASPPVDSHGVTAGVLAGVHLAHVNPANPGATYKPVACAECHVVPAANRHANGTVSMTFAAATGANLGSFTPGFVQGNGTSTATTCTTYCHGSSLNASTTRGSVASWAWNGAAADCGSCHKAPPTTANHHNAAAVTTCSRCHGTTVDATGAVLVAGGLHINGAVDTANLTCATCHGNGANAPTGGQDANLAAAPIGTATANAAPDTYGNTAATSAGVGVHASHLLGSRSKPVACAACHTVPGTPVHKTGVATAGTVTFTGLATQGSVVPAYAGSGGSCSATYCHGNFAGGAGSGATPTWVTAGALGCTSCHGNPPSAAQGHPQNDACATCHGAGYSKTGATTGTVAAATHVDGTVQLVSGGVPVAESCTSCHGTLGRASVALADVNQAAAPPADTTGGSATLAVGAHLAHVNQARPSPLSAPIACVVCHPVPAVNRHGNGTTTVTFTGVAVQGGIANAAYASPACSATWCHGNFTGGAGSVSPAWNATSAQLSCTACHGAPPGPIGAAVKHPQNPNCATCHPGYSLTGPAVVVATHVDGAITHTPATGCTQCHGDTTVAAVAPTDVRAAPAGDANAIDSKGNGAAATSVRGVGAHAKHLTGTAWRGTPLACAECHLVPGAGDVTHVTGVATVSFSSTGLAGTVWTGKTPPAAMPPVWNGANNGPTLTCSATYCHGNFPGGANATPTWATPSAVACGSCHGIPPAVLTDGTTAHVTLSAMTGAGQTCGSCHGGSYTNSTVDPALHLNGKVDGGGESTGNSSCGACHAGIFAGMSPGSAKVTKHTLAGGDVPVDGGGSWTGNLKTSAAYTNATCVSMCHGDHPHDLTSPVTATHENNVYADAATSASRASGSATRVGSGGSGAQNRNRTDFDVTLANGGLCTSCHLNPVDANHPLVDKTAFDASAHDFTSVTVGATSYAWRFQLHDGSFFARDCTKCHASSAEGNTPTVSANGGATTAVHFGDNASLLSGASTGAAAGFVCYNCHGSTAAPADGAQGNRSGKAIQALFSKTGSTHPANATGSPHNSVTEQANAAFGNTLGVTGRHATCLDCHDPHEARPGGRTMTSGTATVSGTAVTGTGTQWSAFYVGAGFRLNTWAAGTWATISAVGGPTSLTLAAAGPSNGTAAAYTITQVTSTAGPALQGAWGAQLTSNPAFWTAPAAGNFTKKVIGSGTDLEATLCMKCHTGYYGALPTSPSSSPAFAETDVAMAFNPANAGNWATAGTANQWSSGETAGGFHPVLADCSGNLGQVNLANLVTTNFPWKTSGTTRNRMSCSDCHESDTATDPNGPHGSAAKFLLKGPNTTWNATLANNGTMNGAFCANCHSSSFANSRYPAHTRSDHFIACFNCHAAIPHGGPRMGMLNPGAGTATAALPAIAGWDATAPYWQGGSSNRLYLKSYPSTNTGSWAQSNCGCNGTGH